MYELIFYFFNPSRRKEFEQACCEYMDEFGFEWVEEFTLNGA
jgi:cbb3-type cytochrome oxidase subunit 3